MRRRAERRAMIVHVVVAWSLPVLAVKVAVEVDAEVDANVDANVDVNVDVGTVGARGRP